MKMETLIDWLIDGLTVGTGSLGSVESRSLGYISSCGLLASLRILDMGLVAGY
jgi:hypothetical protein